MARRKLTIELESVLAAAVGPAEGPDAADDALLDATSSLLAERGLGRWTVEDAARLSGLGRTTVYRRFPARADLVHAVLARELRRTISAAAAAAAAVEAFEDKVVEAVVVCFEALDRSTVAHLLRTDPATVLPLLTTEVGPLLGLARAALAVQILGAGAVDDPRHAEVLAESLARLGLTFVLCRATVVPVGDPVALREVISAVVRPLVQPPHP